MYKHPLHYSTRELENLLHKPIKIHIGPVRSNLVTEIIEGKIIEIAVASNDYNAPVEIQFKSTNNDITIYNILRVKEFSDI